MRQNRLLWIGLALLVLGGGVMLLDKEDTFAVRVGLAVNLVGFACAILGILLRPSPLRNSPVVQNALLDEDFWTIACFAAGDESLREFAVAAARRTPGRGSVALSFMAEVDNSCPDLALRATYREQLLQAALTVGMAAVPDELGELTCIRQARRAMDNSQPSATVFGWLKVDADKIRPLAPRLYAVVNSYRAR